MKNNPVTTSFLVTIWTFQVFILTSIMKKMQRPVLKTRGDKK